MRQGIIQSLCSFAAGNFYALEKRRTWLQPRPTWEIPLTLPFPPVRAKCFSLGVISTILQHARPIPAWDLCTGSAFCQKLSSPSSPQGCFSCFLQDLGLNITFTERILLATSRPLTISQHPYFLTLSYSLIFFLFLQLALLHAI